MKQKFTHSKLIVSQKLKIVSISANNIYLKESAMWLSLLLLCQILNMIFQNYWLIKLPKLDLKLIISKSNIMIAWKQQKIMSLVQIINMMFVWVQQLLKIMANSIIIPYFLIVRILLKKYHSQNLIYQNHIKLSGSMAHTINGIKMDSLHYSNQSVYYYD